MLKNGSLATFMNGLVAIAALGICGVLALSGESSTGLAIMAAGLAFAGGGTIGNRQMVIKEGGN